MALKTSASAAESAVSTPLKSSVSTPFCKLRLQFAQQAADAVDGHRAGDAAACAFTYDHEPGRGAGLASPRADWAASVLIRPSIPLWRMVLAKEAR